MNDAIRETRIGAGELARDVVTAMKKAVQRHGDNSNLTNLLAAGIFAAVTVLDEQAPGFKAIVLQMLQEI